ncbi:MAG: HNH endonuclease [Phocaeicola sp.]
MTGLTKEGKTRLYYVHQLVMLAFSPDRLNETVNHINGIKQDNRLANLEWLSHAENCMHRDKILNHNALGCINPRYKGDILVFKDGIQVMILQGTTDIKEKGFDPGHVSKCLSGKAKTHKGCTFKRA